MKEANVVGLSDEEVLISREKNGTNVLTPPEKEPLWKKFLEKFNDHLIIILLVAGCLSVGISFYEYFGLDKPSTVFFEPIGIFVAILLATGLAFYFEMKADREFAILNQVNDDEPVEVIRSGMVRKVPKRDIVVGDVIVISAGDEIPADAELLEATQLKVDESSLTGEPVCEKTTVTAQFDANATFPSNHVLRGTKVLEGHAVARVFAVGDKTENGKVFEAAQIDDSVRTPLNEQLDGLSSLVTKLSYSIAALVVVGRIVVYLLSDIPFVWVDFLAYLLQTIMIAVTLIVVAVPEGLPMAVTLALAYSMRSMLKTNNLVRKMHACETMGATTVICTDKTGTLTQNQMRISTAMFFDMKEGEKLSAPDDATSRLVAQAVAVNSTAELDLTDASHPTVVGNPTEGALLLWLHDAGMDYRAVRSSVKCLEELPFSTERKYMATVIATPDGRKFLHVKGAPEIVMGLCKEISGGQSRESVLDRLTQFQEQGMRTLGFACKELGADEHPIVDGHVAANDLKLMGVVSIADPVRPEVPDSIRECQQAGIDIKMVTGDTAKTAKEIGRQIGLWNPATDNDTNIITGPELAALSEDELDARVESLKIISRARPMDKKRLVESLQRKNEVVAVTGDGTNDAPALKAAHVGLSMGDGTSVAKEVSDITIIDNSFKSIGQAVLWGRSLYQNIQRFLLFQLTVNVSACLIVLVGAFMGVQSPLTVTQMLWVNLIMDTFGAMALASLPPARSVMKEKPRDRKAFIIDRNMATEIFSIGGIFFLIMLVMLYICEHADITSMADFLSFKLGHANGLTPYEQTLIFSVFVMTHFWYMFDARGYKTGRSGLNLKHCKGFETIAFVILIGQVLIVEVLYRFFDVVPMKLNDWIIIILISSLVLWVREIKILFSSRKATTAAA